MIRPGRDDDSAGVIGLIRDAWAQYEDCILDVDREAPELRAPATFVAGQGGAMFVAGEMDGFVIATRPAPDRWTIGRLYVAAGRRGTGLGKRLLAEVERAAAGAKTLVLHSDSRFTAAHAFYERQGFLRRHPAHVLDDISCSIDLCYAKPLGPLAIEALDAAAAHSAVTALADLLIACVHDGASVSFHAPLPRVRAQSFWRSTADKVAAGRSVLLAAWVEGRIAGTVTVHLDMPQNQLHRADVAKVLVHPALRRRGVARALMGRAETEAWARGRRLLVLDTLTGGAAEALYRGMGWTEVGAIPGFSTGSDGAPESTTFYYRTRP